jgi:hypothetical protein
MLKSTQQKRWLYESCQKSLLRVCCLSMRLPLVKQALPNVRKFHRFCTYFWICMAKTTLLACYRRHCEQGTRDEKKNCACTAERFLSLSKTKSTVTRLRMSSQRDTNAAWPLLGEPSGDHAVPTAAMCSVKADSHIACRAHAVPLQCRAAKGLECVFPIWFTQCGRVWFTFHIFMNQTRPHCVNQMGKTHSEPLAARHGRGTAWARHAMCESAFRMNTSALS